ncbi:hypothetical protein TNCT_723311 [Trichonephila clavata]|uniref:Uncharacterized protein n=1 Tax=Trichonephila clavata TaxID=2740835 RepID=A0A8X6HNA3_TRICU|nr:hypothetical protein TNCT_723311 [Trichonephila clavata]
MDHRAYLGVLDYVVVGLTLIISTIIGLKFRSKNTKDETSKEYLLAGKDMSMFPVVMSITVTMLSGVTILGQPAETYSTNDPLYVRRIIRTCTGLKCSD